MYLDKTIGELVDYLGKEGWLDNSVIVVASDNGGCAPDGGSNLPLRGVKNSYWEGGVKVTRHRGPEGSTPCFFVVICVLCCGHLRVVNIRGLPPLLVPRTELATSLRHLRFSNDDDDSLYLLLCSLLSISPEVVVMIVTVGL